MAQTIVLTKGRTSEEEDSLINVPMPPERLNASLELDLAWYLAMASELKDPRKRRLAEASIKRMSFLLGV